MLKRPDSVEKEILELAAFIETLPPERYSQRHYLSPEGARCICGWQNYRKCRPHMDDNTPGREFGLSWEQSTDLFAARPFPYSESPPTPQKAARVLRYLAETGEVDWRV